MFLQVPWLRSPSVSVTAGPSPGIQSMTNIAVLVKPWFPNVSPGPLSNHVVPVSSSLHSSCLHDVSVHIQALSVDLGSHKQSFSVWCPFSQWTLQVTLMKLLKMLKRTNVRPCLGSENKRAQWVFSQLIWSQIETPPRFPSDVINLIISSGKQTH